MGWIKMSPGWRLPGKSGQRAFPAKLPTVALGND